MNYTRQSEQVVNSRIASTESGLVFVEDIMTVYPTIQPIQYKTCKNFIERIKQRETPIVACNINIAFFK